MPSVRSAFRLRLLHGVLIGLASLFVLVAISVSSLVIVGAASPPASGAPLAPAVRLADHSGLPGLERYRARDGAQLSYRSYPADSGQVAFLIHGAAGSSSDMHVMAHALQASGVAVYVPDLRGHGANYPHGDVEYTGQLDDDLADFVHFVQREHPGATFILIGFSSGGGFVLRIAATDLARSFDHYVLLSPFLAHDAPTVRTSMASPGGQDRADDSDWPTTSTGRIVGLMILDAIGVRQFDGLPVLQFAVSTDDADATSTYSWRMQESFQPHADFRGDIRSVSRPMTVLVGAEDERFLPQAFEPVFDAERSDILVSVLPGLNHADMATSALAVQTVVTTISMSALQDPH